MTRVQTRREKRAASQVRESCGQHDHRGIAQATSREPRRGMRRRCIKRAAALSRAEPRGKQKKKTRGRVSVDTSSRRGTLRETRTPPRDSIRPGFLTEELCYHPEHSLRLNENAAVTNRS